MKTYIAESQTESISNGFLNCLNWAFAKIQDENEKIVKIYLAYPGVKFMRIVAEITRNGITIHKNGRQTRVRKKDKRHEK